MLTLFVQVATKTVASMLALEAVDDQADIKLYINSAGVRTLKLPTIYLKL